MNVQTGRAARMEGGRAGRRREGARSAGGRWWRVTVEGREAVDAQRESWCAGCEEVAMRVDTVGSQRAAW